MEWEGLLGFLQVNLLSLYFSSSCRRVKKRGKKKMDWKAISFFLLFPLLGCSKAISICLCDVRDVAKLDFLRPKELGWLLCLCTLFIYLFISHFKFGMVGLAVFLFCYPFLLEWRWWKEAQEDEDQIEGVLFTVSMNSDFDSDIVLHLRKGDNRESENSKMGSSGRQYALVPEGMWLRALKRWVSENVVFLDDSLRANIF